MVKTQFQRLFAVVLLSLTFWGNFSWLIAFKFIFYSFLFAARHSTVRTGIFNHCRATGHDSSLLFVYKSQFPSVLQCIWFFPKFAVRSHFSCSLGKLFEGFLESFIWTNFRSLQTNLYSLLQSMNGKYKWWNYYHFRDLVSHLQLPLGAHVLVCNCLIGHVTYF